MAALDDIQTVVGIATGVAALAALLVGSPLAYRKLREQPRLDIVIEGSWLSLGDRPVIRARVSLTNESERRRMLALSSGALACE